MVDCSRVASFDELMLFVRGDTENPGKEPLWSKDGGELDLDVGELNSALR